MNAHSLNPNVSPADGINRTGIVSGHHLLLVFTDCYESQDETFNDWYNNEHVPDLLGCPGFVAAQRFKLVDRDGEPAVASRYLVVYELEGDPVTNLSKLDETRHLRRFDESMDQSMSRSSLYEPIADRQIASDPR